MSKIKLFAYIGDSSHTILQNHKLSFVKFLKILGNDGD